MASKPVTARQACPHSLFNTLRQRGGIREGTRAAGCTMRVENAQEGRRLGHMPGEHTQNSHDVRGVRRRNLLDLPDILFQHRGAYGGPVGEVPVQHSLTNAGTARDRGQRCVQTVLRVNFPGGGDESNAVASGDLTSLIAGRLFVRQRSCHAKRVLPQGAASRPHQKHQEARRLQAAAMVSAPLPCHRTSTSTECRVTIAVRPGQPRRRSRPGVRTGSCFNSGAYVQQRRRSGLVRGQPAGLERSTPGACATGGPRGPGLRPHHRQPAPELERPARDRDPAGKSGRARHPGDRVPRTPVRWLGWKSGTRRGHHLPRHRPHPHRASPR